MLNIIRLIKDINELSDLEQIHLEKTEDSKTVHIIFDKDDGVSSSESNYPNVFAVTISWYYPHQHPEGISYFILINISHYIAYNLFIYFFMSIK